MWCLKRPMARKPLMHNYIYFETLEVGSERQKSANTTRSKVRARVEHVFGQQQNSMGGKIVRTIGIVRARFKIGMMNLGYNIRRLVQLERMAAAPA